MNPMRPSTFLTRASLVGVVLGMASLLAQASGGSFSGQFNTVTRIASTVPSNGDVNPYGIAVVPRSRGALVAGHILVSNFNNSANLQGTGTTIMDIAPNGTVKVFAQISASNLPGPCPGGVGLTTALVVLRSGWVVVGSLPTTDGTSATAKAGCLLVLNSHGRVVETLSGSRQGVAINGPWDMTAFDGGEFAELFVSNVLNGTVAANGSVVNRGTVVRIVLLLDEDEKPRELFRNAIGTGFPERTDPAALVIGPTGLGLAHDGTLYVADTLSNRIAAIPHALNRTTSGGTGTTVSQGDALNGPLGLAVEANGDILTVNSNDGNMVEVSPEGKQVSVLNVD